MRALPCALFVAATSLAACGGSNEKTDAGPGDGGPGDAPIDAPVLPACANPANGTTISLQLVTPVGNDGAMLVTSPPGDPRLFLVERAGIVEIYDNGALKPDAFLDVNTMIVSDSGQGERGLLGLAFHPQYGQNGQFFIYYTTNNANVVARCNVSTTNPDVAEPTCTPILSIPDFASNHNGGMIEFGPDGYLYISTGDGGGGGDPALNGQALTDGSPCPGAANCQNNSTTQAWLGKMLRIDVDSPSNGKMYGIPADNPYASSGGKPEIFASGLRNAWRWSFDPMTGDIWIADVGQGAREEVNYVPAGQLAGKNFGWSKCEGTAAYYGPCGDNDGTFKPQIEHTHGAGYSAIIGGQVYRGTCFPDIRGWYFYSDNGKRVLSRAVVQGTTVSAMELPVTIPQGPASIHADARGELYVTTVAGGTGNVYRIVAGP